MHATYGVIAGGGGGDAIPPLVSGGDGGILPSVAFPPSVIFPPCANAGATIDIPSADVTAVLLKRLPLQKIQLEFLYLYSSSSPELKLQTI